MLVESAATKPSLLSNNISPGRLASADSPDWKALQTQIVEHKALCQAAQVERDRLLELVAVLQKRLVTQLDENEALKAALEATVRNREEDFKLYQDTMDQVKDIFLQAIRQQKQEGS
ncbi:hypothetical protein AV530_004749 [Patagioenas fasciata monilis]|uniref:Uncharacterized protein n=1 Tax=Patagioenas fasciata monilis TaxID=372326 RepID=A0A1V4KDR8_PATFA|nr:hypothetical protein AV530_004749 [Patagioenas fasciata monilis]